MGSFSRFVGLSRRKKGIAAKAMFWLVIYRISLWILPVKTSRNSILSNRIVEFGQNETEAGITESIVRAIQLCSRFVPSATCLTQALAARKLLESEGYAATLKIGVAKDGSIFQAHAWLELDGRIILGKRPSHAKYFTLT